MKQIIRWKLDALLWIVFEGPEIDSHDFEEVLDILKEISSKAIKL